MRPFRLAALLGAALLGASASTSPVHAALISSQTDSNPNATGFVDDGVISVNEYSTVYTGGGTGFGGPLGLGTLYMDTDGTNLYIGFDPGATMNDNFVLHLDTKAGGFTDAMMNDTADPGRNLLTNLTRDVDDPFPILPDYGIVMGPFGQVSFELTSGSLNFISFQNDQTGTSDTLAREFAIPLSAIGNPTSVDFFASYGSDTNFMSNESLPVEAFNAGPNPGFDNNGTFAPVVHANYDQFNVPEPTSLGVLSLAALAGLARRRTR